MRSLLVTLTLGFTLSAPMAVAAGGPQVPPPAPRPQSPAPAPAATIPAAPAPTAPEQAPTEQQLGLPLYPGAQFIRSYEAGRGQRYYLFGTAAGYDQVVAYYRTAMKQRGDIVFERPATYMFEVGRYKAETMAFPPGVTVKDFTWAGSAGYPNTAPNAKPAHFATVVQIVPIP